MSDTPRKYAQCTREEWFERWEAWTANDYIAEEEQMAMRDCFAHIEELERENAAIRHDLITLCLRLCMEPNDSHSPDTADVLNRWRKAWEAAAAGEPIFSAIDAAIAQGKNQQSNVVQPKE